jgi:predicted AlkP superfamily phosphohydrolase/phosphomutase
MRRVRRLLAWLFVLALLGVALAVILTRTSGGSIHRTRKVIVLGIDGMDPRLLRQFMNEGKMPSFSALAEQGSFLPLGTSIPPQSPVAWSNLITGLDPGGHGIFDFIHRDPATMTPYFSTSEVKPPEHNLRLGDWVIPLSSGHVNLLRKGKAFWQYLGEHGIPLTVFRIPSNFPPVPTKGRTFAGMGTPDLMGSYGTFAFYTDDPVFTSGPVNGGVIYPVKVEGDRVSTALQGPVNTFQKKNPQLTVSFTVDRDPIEPVARVLLQDQEFILREGEWSPWVRVKFTFIPLLESVTGICRFYLKQVRPQFELYVTAINIDPSQPALPISTPASYARELWRDVGHFYTQGIAEDTKALTGGLLNDREYLEQAHSVFDDQRKLFRHELNRFRAGFFFFYFSSLDQNAHMFWRAIDKNHSPSDPVIAAEYGKVLEGYYEEMDQLLGEVLKRVDENTTLLVLSDHGFAPYDRSFNLNTWLRENGYLVLQKGAPRQGGDIFRDADWSRTRAYGLGLNALYLNLRGRERDGIVKPGAEADALLAEISARLLAVRDPLVQLPVVTRVDRASEVYSGPATSRRPDLIVGYNRGYRVGWESVLGGVATTTLMDNTEHWNGDHCMDFTQVPGVVLSNRKIQAGAPALTDIAPTILAEFGIQKATEMRGRSIFEPPAPRPTAASRCTGDCGAR